MTLGFSDFKDSFPIDTCRQRRFVTRRAIREIQILPGCWRFCGVHSKLVPTSMRCQLLIASLKAAQKFFLMHQCLVRLNRPRVCRVVFLWFSLVGVLIFLKKPPWHLSLIRSQPPGPQPFGLSRQL
jgi:hypothetical protein